MGREPVVDLWGAAAVTAEPRKLPSEVLPYTDCPQQQQSPLLQTLPHPRPRPRRRSFGGMSVEDEDEAVASGPAGQLELMARARPQLIETFVK
jgi:hypothetical protein